VREIVFDTETTGFEPGEGHRIVEIGCVELMDHFPTGRTLQFYLNPERDVPIESQRVHGLSNEFLADKPLFALITRGNGPAEVFIASITCSILSYVLFGGVKRNREEALGFPP